MDRKLIAYTVWIEQSNKEYFEDLLDDLDTVVVYDLVEQP